MAVQLIEGFEAGSLDVGFGYYGTANITTNPTAGPWSTYAYVVGQQNMNLLFNSAHTEHYGAVRYNNQSLANYDLVEAFAINGYMIWRIRMLVSGVVQFQDSGQTTQGTSSHIIYPNSFNLIEWYVNTATGACKLRMHGLTTDEFSVASGGDYDPGTGLNSMYGLALRTGSGGVYDDVIVYDTVSSGSSYYSWVGDKGVTGIRPDGSTASEAWSPGGGGNWDKVNDATPDDASTYVSTSTDNALDMYTMQNIPSAVAMAGPIVIKARIKKDDPGTRTITLPYKTSGAQQNPAALPVPTGQYAYAKTLLDKDGTDNADWTDAKVNSLQVGLKATT